MSDYAPPEAWPELALAVRKAVQEGRYDRAEELASRVPSDPRKVDTSKLMPSELMAGMSLAMSRMHIHQGRRRYGDG